MKFAARLISWFFHPILFATYLVALLAFTLPMFLMVPPAFVLKLVAFVFVITFVFPVANVLLLKAFGSIRSIEMRERGERVLPFTMVTIFYGIIAFLFFYKVGTNANLNKMMLLVAVMSFVATVVTFFYKISVHSMAIGGLLGILVPLNKAADDGQLLLPTVILIFVAGIIMSARLLLQVHTLREVFYGGVAGFLTGFTGMYFLF